MPHPLPKIATSDAQIAVLSAADRRVTSWLPDSFTWKLRDAMMVQPIQRRVQSERTLLVFLVARLASHGAISKSSMDGLFTCTEKRKPPQGRDLTSLNYGLYLSWPCSLPAS